jgi:hypothetical protein
MMVISAWYTERDIGKGVKPLRKVAQNASRAIHESQQLFNVRIDVKEISLAGKSSKRWLMFPGGKKNANRDAVLTVVDCLDAQGKRKQNTIGFIREPTTGQVYLVYFADTINKDKDIVFQEISETLSSIRVPSMLPSCVKKHVWYTVPPIPLESS